MDASPLQTRDYWSQRSIPEPIFFNIHINDLAIEQVNPQNVCRQQIWRSVLNTRGLCWHLDRQEKWAKTKLMESNKGKHNVLIRRGITPYLYEPEADCVESSFAEKNLKVLDEHKPATSLSSKRGPAASLAALGRTSPAGQMILLLPSALVRHTECWFQVWAPRYKTGHTGAQPWQWLRA